MSQRERINYPYGGKYCCAVGCHNSTYRDVPRGIKFHAFPKDPERRRRWEIAVNRENPDKSLWRARATHVLCSEHFAGGKKSDKKDSVSYIPSIFPTRHTKEIPSGDSARAKRREKFEDQRKKHRERENPLPSTSQGRGVAGTDEEEGEEEDDNTQGAPASALTAAGAGAKTAGAAATVAATEVPDVDLETSYPEEICLEQVNFLNKNDHFLFKKLKLFLFQPPSKAPLLDIGIQVRMGEGIEKLTSTWIPPTTFSTDWISPTEKATQVEREKEEKKPANKASTTQTEKEALLPFSTFNDKQFKSFCGVEKNFVEFLLGEVQNSDGFSLV